MKRRDFLTRTAAAAAMLSCFPSDLSAVERQRPRGKMERRALGKSGLKLSMLGFGGFALNGRTPEQARELVQEAYEAGVNYSTWHPAMGMRRK